MERNALPRYDELPKAKGNAGSGWGLFGADDSLGLVSLQTPERIAAAAQLIRRGAMFSLNLPLGEVRPAMFDRGVPRHTPFRSASGAFDDVIDNVYPQATSQWDSLGHVPFEGDTFYNGASADDIVAGRRNTIEHWARRGIAGRALLLDVRRSVSYEPGTSYAISVADLERARERAAVTYQPGDALLIHTGYLEWYLAQSPAARAALAPRTTLQAVGLEHTESMARYLWDTHACAVVSDNPSVEVWPPDRGAWPFGFLHHVLIGQFGLALGELWWLKDLADDCAADGVHEAFLAAAPLHVRGGIGSPANALAFK
jgi:kynurenine formamidase